MSICTVRKSNWAICVEKYYVITIKLFFSERCSSTVSKTETVKRDSKFFESDMLGKFGRLFKSVPYATVTVKSK